MPTNYKQLTKDQLRAIIGKYDPKLIFTKLAEGAATHVMRSPLFSAAQYNPQQETHDFTKVSFKPLPQGLDKMVELLAFARPDWRETILPAFEAQPELIADLVERLRRPKSKVSLVLAHDLIEDIAYHLATLIYILARYEPYDELVQKMHIVLGNVVRTIDAFGSPAAEILRQICWVHFSFPRTATTGKLGLPLDMIDASNELVRREINEFDVIINAVAAPGSIDLVFHIPRYMIPKRFHGLLSTKRAMRHHTVHIQPAGFGTFAMVKGEVFAVASMLSARPFYVEVGRLVVIKTHNDLHRLLEWVAERRTEGTGVPTIYHRTLKRIVQLKDYIDERRSKSKPPE